MKKFVTLIVFACALAVSARAFYLDGSVGYLVDSKEAYLAARGGWVVKSSNSVHHALELEIAHTKETDSNTEGTIMPLTVNYRAEFPGPGNLTPFLGFGAGAARVKIEAFGFSESNTVFAAQAFAGAGYKLSDAATLKLAARYIRLGEAELFGIPVEVGDDVSVEIALSVKF